MTDEVNSTANLDGNAALIGIGSIAQNFGPITIAQPVKTKPEATQPAAYSVAIKYLADREQQEALIRENLINCRQSRRPIIFFLHGQPEQCMDAFVERLGNDTMRKTIRSINKIDQIEWKMVLWPQPAGSGASSSDRVTIYTRNLIGELDIVSPTTDAVSIATKIAHYRRPVLITSVHREIIGDDHEGVIGGILDMWSTLPDLRTELSLIICIAFIYADKKKGFAGWFGRNQLSGLSQALASFRNYRPEQINTVVLPELGNVTVEETEHWVRNILRPADIEEALRVARGAFGNRTALPMTVVLQQLDELVPKYRPKLRLQ